MLPRGVKALPEAVSVGLLDVVSTIGAVVASLSPSFLACHYDCRSGLDERQANYTRLFLLMILLVCKFVRRVKI